MLADDQHSEHSGNEVRACPRVCPQGRRCGELEAASDTLILTSAAFRLQDYEEEGEEMYEDEDGNEVRGYTRGRERGCS